MRYLIKYFRQFRRFLGRKIYYLLYLILIVGFVEGIGITLFLPILQNGFGDDKLSQILKALFAFFHLNFSFVLFLILILSFFILRSVFLILYSRYFGRLFANLSVGLIRRLLNCVFDADYLYLLKKEIGFINNTIIHELSRVLFAFYTFTQVIGSVVYASFYIILSLILNFRVTALLAIFSPICIIFMRKLNLLTSRDSRKLSLSHSKFNSAMIQLLSKLKYLKATLSYSKISKIIDKENRNLGSLRFRLFFWGNLARNALEPVLVFVIIGLLFYYVIILKRSVSEVIFLIFLFLQVARQFLAAQINYRKFLASIGSIEIFNNFERELEENKEDLRLNGIAPNFDRRISFKNVTVIFPNGKKALDGVNITINPRSVIAIVGHSGSGKSTIANVISGILRPTKGEVFFGDISYNDLNLKELRENIGYVTQEDVIFNADIKDNISLWDEFPDNVKLKKAMEIAHLADFVEDLAKKEREMLGDNGLDISGGQRQRITIAREVYKNAKFLILDEATSSLDSESENSIYENLRRFRSDKTILIIAHRLSTIKNADYIYVMHKGKVIEEGIFDELYGDRNTEFYRICQLQEF